LSHERRGAAATGSDREGDGLPHSRLRGPGAPRGDHRARLHAAAARRAGPGSGAPRIVLAVGSDVEEDPEAGNEGDHERTRARPADPEAQEHDVGAEPERPEERARVVRAGGGAGHGRDSRQWGRVDRARPMPLGPKKIHRAGCAFVPRTRWLSASAYSPQAQLRPTRAPCSVQAAQ
jgi:hypothetical protein